MARGRSTQSSKTHTPTPRQVAPAGGCLATLPGGDPARIGADGSGTVSFSLALTTSHAPGAAQLCYRRAADASGAWREVRPEPANENPFS